MSKSRKALAKEIGTQVDKYIGSIDRAGLLIELAVFDRICVAYNREGRIHVFLSEGSREFPNKRVDYDIARYWIAAPVSLIYPSVFLCDFVPSEPDGKEPQKALAMALAENQVEVPPEPQSEDALEWQDYFDELIFVLKRSPATKAMIRAQLQEEARWVDYELLIEEEKNKDAYLR